MSPDRGKNEKPVLSKWQRIVEAFPFMGETTKLPLRQTEFWESFKQVNSMVGINDLTIVTFGV